MSQQPVIDNQDFKKILKKIRSDYTERTSPFDFSELKNYFQGFKVSSDQADMLWKYLDSHMIMVAHIDEDDPLFASVPEVNTAETVSASSSAPAEHEETPAPSAAGRQDVSNVRFDSTAIARVLIQRECKKQELTDVDSYIEDNEMNTARSLARSLRPNEMHALAMYWQIDETGNSWQPFEIRQVTGIALQELSEIEKKAASCTPKIRTKSRRGFFDFLKKR